MGGKKQRRGRGNSSLKQAVSEKKPSKLANAESGSVAGKKKEGGKMTHQLVGRAS